MQYEDRLVKIREVAEILGFSKSFLEKNPASVPRVKIGRSVSYRLSDLMTIVKSGADNTLREGH